MALHRLAGEPISGRRLANTLRREVRLMLEWIFTILVLVLFLYIIRELKRK